MQPRRFAFSCIHTEKSVFPLLSGKGLGLPAFCCKAALKGLTGQEKIILATLRYFFLPGVAQKGNPRGQRPIKSGKHIPMGLFIHKIKDYETTDYQKNQQTCNSDDPNYGNMSADKQRNCSHWDDYDAVACKRIHRFRVQDNDHDSQNSYSFVHCSIICRITIKI